MRRRSPGSSISPQSCAARWREEGHLPSADWGPVDLRTPGRLAARCFSEICAAVAIWNSPRAHYPCCGQEIYGKWLEVDDFRRKIFSRGLLHQKQARGDGAEAAWEDVLLRNGGTGEGGDSSRGGGSCGWGDRGNRGPRLARKGTLTPGPKRPGISDGVCGPRCPRFLPGSVTLCRFRGRSRGGRLRGAFGPCAPSGRSRRGVPGGWCGCGFRRGGWSVGRRRRGWRRGCGGGRR